MKESISDCNESEMSRDFDPSFKLNDPFLMTLYVTEIRKDFYPVFINSALQIHFFLFVMIPWEYVNNWCVFRFVAVGANICTKCLPTFLCLFKNGPFNIYDLSFSVASALENSTDTIFAPQFLWLMMNLKIKYAGSKKKKKVTWYFSSLNLMFR